MINLATKNEIKVVLEEYLGKQKATIVAEKIFEILRAECKHTNQGKIRKYLTASDLQQMEKSERIGVNIIGLNAQHVKLSLCNRLQEPDIYSIFTSVYSRIREFEEKERKNRGFPILLSTIDMSVEEVFKIWGDDIGNLPINTFRRILIC